MIRDAKIPDERIVGPETIANVLLERSAWVYARLATAEEYGLHLGEVTLTETLLLEIRTALPGLEVKIFNQQEEGRTGADWQWEWWFHGKQWFGIRAQAKLLKTAASTTHGVGYLSGKYKRPQIDLLINDARREGLAPAYVFYGGPELDSVIGRIPWNCSTLTRGTDNLGVSFLPATAARSLLNSPGVLDLTRVAGAAKPWTCLFRCMLKGCESWSDPPRARALDSSAARSFYLADFEASHPNYQPEERDRFRDSHDGENSDLDRLVAEAIRPEPPHYVQALQRMHGEITKDDAHQVSELLPHGVGAITVFELPPPPPIRIKYRRKRGQ